MSRLHEFHAWVGLALSTDGEGDLAQLEREVERLESLINERTFHDASLRIERLNGLRVFTATGFVNRRRDEANHLSRILASIADRFGGAWGLLYERDDGDSERGREFAVSVLARGQINKRKDPFLSPCVPTIED